LTLAIGAGPAKVIGRENTATIAALQFGRGSVKGKLGFSGKGTFAKLVKIELNAFINDAGQFPDGNVNLGYPVCFDGASLLQRNRHYTLRNGKLMHAAE
jgi:hypothetical protein